MSLINTIACGDCREILPTLPAKSFQLAFADPPYWVGFDYGEKTDKEMAYIEPDFLVNELLRIAECVLITPGIGNLYDYPKPLWIASWYKGSSASRNAIGFNHWEPILVYGKPKIIQSKFRPDVIKAVPSVEAEASFHKCPKPLKLLMQLIEWFTESGQAVLDPVSGSGTTCKAAFQLGREYLGIEIDPKIVELSLARLHNSQPPLLAMGGLTPRVPDLWDSAPLQALSTPEADTIAGHLSTPPTSG